MGRIEAALKESVDGATVVVSAEIVAFATSLLSFRCIN
mgnify:CR=1 FL=1